MPTHELPKEREGGERERGRERTGIDREGDRGGKGGERERPPPRKNAEGPPISYKIVQGHKKFISKYRSN